MVGQDFRVDEDPHILERDLEPMLFDETGLEIERELIRLLVVMLTGNYLGVGKQTHIESSTVLLAL
jgi:hypothetical protein